MEVGLLPGRRDFCLERVTLPRGRKICVVEVLLFTGREFAQSWGFCLAVRKIWPNRGGRALASCGRPVGKLKFAEKNF